MSDPQIIGLLPSLSAAWVPGLALLADELSFPVGVNDALLTPGD